MPLTAKIEKNNDKEVLHIEITGAIIEQLKELADFLEGEGFDMPVERDKRLEKVVVTGISWLESLKQRKMNLA